MTANSFPTLSTPTGEIPADAPVWNRQRHSDMPSHRYTDAYHRVDVPLHHEQRSWPTKRLAEAPLWVPVDLRDGNQALAEPMDPARKQRFFQLMVAMGYKEIEVGYPSASQTDFDFVRLIADTDIAPDDVTIVVFTPARRDLIERTVASIQGITNPVVIHMYTATAPAWREMVLGHDQESMKTSFWPVPRTSSTTRRTWPMCGSSSALRSSISPNRTTSSTSAMRSPNCGTPPRNDR